jgi:hypothetical protein
VGSAAQFLTKTFLNSVSNSENISALISQEKKEPVQNLIPTTLGIIIVLLASTISSFAEIVANKRQEEATSASRIISVTVVEKNAKRLALFA